MVGHQRKRFLLAGSLSTSDPNNALIMGASWRGQSFGEGQHLPLLHNPNKLGIRMPMGLSKFQQTFRELKSQFSGFNVSAGVGWSTEDRIWDPYLRVDFDAEVTRDLEEFFAWWQEILRVRFAQRSIFMALSSPVKWIY
jgi:hypothetical protein